MHDLESREVLFFAAASSSAILLKNCCLLFIWRFQQMTGAQSNSGFNLRVHACCSLGVSALIFLSASDWFAQLFGDFQPCVANTVTIVLRILLQQPATDNLPANQSRYLLIKLTAFHQTLRRSFQQDWSHTRGPGCPRWAQFYWFRFTWLFEFWLGHPQGSVFFVKISRFVQSKHFRVHWTENLHFRL